MKVFRSPIRTSGTPAQAPCSVYITSCLPAECGVQASFQTVNFTLNTAKTQGGAVFHSAATGKMTDVFLISNQGNDGVSTSP